jgi:ACS family glucarate transporter-like MFS transporter
MRHFVLAALCAATVINYVQRNSIAGAETTIRRALDLTILQTGDAGAAFFLAYALCQIPSGKLAQRLTPRWALALYAAGWSLAMAGCALATGAATLVGARLVMGVFQAGIFPCATMILLVWYPSKRRALATAILNSFMLIGGAVGSMLTSWLLTPLGWRGLFVLYALPGIAWAVWFALWFRNRPSEHPAVNAAELALLDGDRPAVPDIGKRPLPAAENPEDRQAVTAADESARALTSRPPGPLELEAPTAAPDVRAATPLLAIFLSWPLLFLCLQQFCRAGATRFFDMWLPTYLQEARALPRDEANLLTSAPLWAGVVGGVVGGWVSDTVLQATGSRRAGRQGVAIASLLGCFACYAAAFLTADVYAAVALVSAGAFIAMFSAPCAYALSMDMGGRNLAVVFGAMNMVGNFGSGAFTWFSPRLKEWSGGWTLPVLVFAGLHLVAAGCWLLLNPEGQIGEPWPERSVLPRATEEVDGGKRLP